MSNEKFDDFLINGIINEIKEDGFKTSKGDLFFKEIVSKNKLPILLEKINDRSNELKKIYRTYKRIWR